MVVKLDEPQPTFDLPDLDTVLDCVDDKPDNTNTVLLHPLQPFQLSPIVFGGAALSNFYNTQDTLNSDVPVRIVRLALRYGIKTFDTSSYYGPSEIVLGQVLKSLANEFPRSSYRLMTKCGRFGAADFDYSPKTLRACVQRSLRRLHTTYLDTVYLHDVEFIAEAMSPTSVKFHTAALSDEAELYGLQLGNEAMIQGPGDQMVLDGLSELRKMQEEGLIKHIGITGYPLPCLLRLAILVLHQPPYKPLDMVLSYSHLTLQNDSLRVFASAFASRARIGQLLTASPLCMGLLTLTPPTWHPAPNELLEVVRLMNQRYTDWDGGLPDLAIGYAIKLASQMTLPLVVGLSSLKEVHEVCRIWNRMALGIDVAERSTREIETQKVFDDNGFLNWSWPSEAHR